MCLVQSVPRTLAEVEKRVIAEVELDMYLIIISSGAKYKYYATFFYELLSQNQYSFLYQSPGNGLVSYKIRNTNIIFFEGNNSNT